MPSPDMRAAADQRLASTVDELIRAVGHATAVLRATSVAVGKADQERTELSTATAATARTERDDAAAEHLGALREELIEDLSGLPAAATLDLDSADWGSALAQTPTVVPRVLRVGTVVSPAGVDVADALVPNPMLANVTLHGGSDDRARLLGVVESLLVRTLVTAPRGGLRVHVLDPHHSGTSLSRFGIADPAGAGIFEATAVTGSDIRARLDQLKNRVATVSQRFLQGVLPDLETYNATADVREQHHLVVALDVASYDSAVLAELLTLARTGGPSGVHVLALVDAGSPRPPGSLDLGPVLEARAGLVVSDGRPRLSGIVQDHGVVLDAPPDSDLVHAVVSTAQAWALEGPAGRTDTHGLGGRDYGDHLEGMLAHLARAAAQADAAQAAEQAERERFDADRDALLGEIEAHLQTVRGEVDTVRAPVGEVAVGLANRLDAALQSVPGEGQVALRFDLAEAPRLVVDDVLRPVTEARRAIHDAITGVRTAHAAAERADRLEEWRRKRRRGIGRDVAFLGVGFALAIAWLVQLYWFSGPIGPFSLALAALFVSGLMAGWVTLCRSWTFGRLADKPEERGGLEAFLLMGGIALCLYGPAPRPEREDLEKFLFGWLDSLTVVVAPLIGVVLVGCALRNVRALVRLPAAPAADPSVDAVGARG